MSFFFMDLCLDDQQLSCSKDRLQQDRGPLSSRMLTMSDATCLAAPRGKAMEVTHRHRPLCQVGVAPLAALALKLVEAGSRGSDLRIPQVARPLPRAQLEA